MKKKIITTALLLGLIFLPLNTKAITKNETIYTTLDSTGKQISSKVTNHLSRFDTETIKDETELKNILNINSDTSFTQDGNNLNFPNYGKDIFYEGTTEKDLPLDVKITYYLNDEEKSINDIVGKNGKIKIKIEFTNKLAQQVNVSGSLETLYTPFVITAGTIIKSDNNYNVSVSNGKAVSTGTKNIVLGLAASGVYESLKQDELKDINTITISYETEKMSLNNIYLVITPKMLDNQDLKIFDKVDTLYSNMFELQKNMNKIVDGASNLEQGANKLKNGSTELTNGLNTVVTNLKELTTGANSLQDGLQKAVNSLNEAKKLLTSGNSSNSLENLKALISKNNETISILQTTNKSLETNYNTYKLGSLTESQIMQSGMDKDTIEKLITLKKTYEANIGLITLLQTNNQALSEMTKTVNNLVNQVNTLLTSLTSGLNELNNGAIKLNGGLQALSTGINKIYAGSKELQSGTSTLYDGTKELKTGVETFNKEGIEKLNATSANLKKQSDKVKELINLSEEYKGFASNNADDSIFIYKVESKN